MMFVKASIRLRSAASCTAPVLAVVVFLLFIFQSWTTISDHVPVSFPKRSSLTKNKMNSSISATARKLLNHGDREKGSIQPDRIWSDKCSKSDIMISQGATEPLPNGIPTYTVEVMNVCVSGCDISTIHLSCGWFSSARLVNPRVFKRLHFDDCLVNDGKPLINGRTLSFQYANTFPYPLAVSSITC